MSADDARSRAAAHEAFEQIALPFLPDVARFALSLARNRDDADDIVQETFLRAQRSWHTFQLDADPRRWLFTIARNVFLRSRERAQRQVATADDTELETLAAVNLHVGLQRDSAEDLLTRLDVQPALERAMADLSPEYRVAVALVDLEELSYEEAAAVAQVPIGTIRSRLYRGRRLLQESLVTQARDAGIIPLASRSSDESMPGISAAGGPARPTQPGAR
jgi:RNA polymerase sigma-70 factor (ECF subfamily)